MEKLDGFFLKMDGREDRCCRCIPIHVGIVILALTSFGLTAFNIFIITTLLILNIKLIYVALFITTFAGILAVAAYRYRNFVKNDNEKTRKALPCATLLYMISQFLAGAFSFVQPLLTPKYHHHGKLAKPLPEPNTV